MYHSKIRTFEQLREYIWEEKQSSADCLIDRIEELNTFEQGRWKGEIDAYDNLLQVLRNILEYGEDLDEMAQSDDALA